MNLVDKYQSTYVLLRNISKVHYSFLNRVIEPGEAILIEEGIARTFEGMVFMTKWFQIEPYNPTVVTATTVTNNEFMSKEISL